MKFVDPTKLYRKSGGMGHPGIDCTFCRGQEMPRFLSRGSATPVNDFKESGMKFADPTNELKVGAPVFSRCYRPCPTKPCRRLDL